MASRSISTPIGAVTVSTSALGVCRIEFGSAVASSPEVADGSADHLEVALTQLREYFDGDRRSFTVPIDRSGRIGFRGDVLRALEDVGYGEVVTYGDLAGRAGSERAARAVGTAMATNPIPILVPCHRVIRSGGRLGHYGAGDAAKQWLLRLEGMRTSD